MVLGSASAGEKGGRTLPQRGTREPVRGIIDWSSHHCWGELKPFIQPGLGRNVESPPQVEVTAPGVFIPLATSHEPKTEPAFLSLYKGCTAGPATPLRVCTAPTGFLTHQLENGVSGGPLLPQVTRWLALETRGIWVVCVPAATPVHPHLWLLARQPIFPLTPTHRRLQDSCLGDTLGEGKAEMELGMSPSARPTWGPFPHQILGRRGFPAPSLIMDLEPNC